MAAEIPAFYFHYFATFDPIVCVWGAGLMFFARDTVTESFIPDSPRNPLHDMLYYQIGGHLLALGVLSYYLLRRSPDLQVWRAYQTAELLVDFSILAGTYDTYSKQGRLDPATWRWEDWASGAITVAATVTRIAFLLGIGVRKGDVTKKDQ